MTANFVNLHTHSYYSILEGTMSPAKILERAQSLNCEAVALTDSGNGHGLIELVQKAKKLEGIKPIIGAEINVAKDSRFEKRSGLDGHEGSIVLLAKNKQGYENLLQLISIGNLQGFYHQPRVDWETLEKYKAGLVCLTGATEGLVGKSFELEGKDMATAVLKKIQDCFGDQCFLEL